MRRVGERMREMELLGPATVVMMVMALAAALVVMVRSPRQGSRPERAFWVAVVFFVPILGPLLYLSRGRAEG
jgi:hypothetical protein